MSNPLNRKHGPKPVHKEETMKMSLTGTFAVACATYAAKLVTDLEVERDPRVPGVYALQATYDDGSVVQFLVRGVPVQDVTDRDLEEVEFTSWPPTSDGNPTTFLM